MKKLLLVISLVIVCLSASAQKKPTKADSTYIKTVTLSERDFLQLQNFGNMYVLLLPYHPVFSDPDKIAEQKNVNNYMLYLNKRIKIDSVRIKK